MFAPVTQALADDALVGRGCTVLDVATGPGEPALTLAGWVGSEGKIVGIDSVAEMVEAARRAADRSQCGNVQFQVAPAERLPFPADSFDAVVCRFGIMFVPSPIDAVGEMLRVLKPGKKLALAVWHFADRNPFQHTLARVIERYVESPPLPPDAVDTFRFAAPGKLKQIVAEAGAIAPSERLFQFAIEAPLSVEEYWRVRSEMSDSLREKLASLPDQRRSRLKREAFEVLENYATNGGMSFPAEVLIVSGTKGGQA